MIWWYLFQAVVGVATIVILVDAGLTKDDPYLVKLAFIGAFVATWLVAKFFDLWNRLLIAREEASRNRSAANEASTTASPPSQLSDHTVRD